MRLDHTVIALGLIAVVCACAASQDDSSDAGPAQESALADSADPMAPFARMTPGEWRVTAQSGTSMFDTWHWGPGRRSMRVMTDGSDAAGNPWCELQVFYWHPGRKQVCLLGLSPYGAGVSEGTIRFDGQTADAVFDMYQTGDRRKLALRWTFDGPDKYHEALLEATGPAGYQPLAAWDYIRSLTPGARPPAPDEAPGFPERLRALEPLVGHTWGASGEWATGGEFHVQSGVEWVPYANGICARVSAPGPEGERTHVLDAYFYHHTGAGSLRCLALSDRGRGGGVYEGGVTVLDDGSLQADLKGYEDDRVVPLVVRFDFEQDGTLRHRVWSIEGDDRTLMLDVHHKKLDAE